MTAVPQASYDPAKDAHDSYSAAIEAKRLRGDANPIKREIQIGDCRLILGDCLDVLPLLGKVDAVVTDPPYGIGYHRGGKVDAKGDTYAGGMYRTGFDPIAGDDQEFDPTPVLGWPCIIWGANNFAHRLPGSGGWLCWHKAPGINGYRASEFELAWSNAFSRSFFTEHLWHGFKRATESGKSVLHPTQKPVELMKWCIGFIPQARTILDPYMGSGTTGVACVKLGRKFIGIEIDEGYFDIACDRIRKAYAQPDMFIEAERPEEPKQDALPL